MRVYNCETAGKQLTELPLDIGWSYSVYQFNVPQLPLDLGGVGQIIVLDFIHQTMM